VNNFCKRHANTGRKKVCGTVDRYKAMARVFSLGSPDAASAVIPVRAVDALVTDTVDGLVTVIAKSAMLDITACTEHLLLIDGEAGQKRGTAEFVARIMSVVSLAETGDTEIIVVTVLTNETLLLGEVYMWSALNQNKQD
jgi:hypothetical protein